MRQSGSMRLADSTVPKKSDTSSNVRSSWVARKTYQTNGVSMASDQQGTKDDTSKDDKGTAKDDKGTAEPTTAGTIRGFITEEIKRLLPTMGKGDAPAGQAAPSTKDESNVGSVQQQVQAALQALQRKEERERRDKEVDEFLAEAKKEKEKPPVERRRVEKIMRWGE